MKKKYCYHSYEKRKKLDKYNKLNKNNWCSNVVIFRSQGYGSITISLRHSAGGFLTLVLEDSFTHEKRFAMFSEFKQCSHGWDLKSIGGSPRRFRNCTFEAFVFLFQCNFMRRKT